MSRFGKRRILAHLKRSTVQVKLLLNTVARNEGVDETGA